MTNPNNWPDPDRPGVPLNPEQDSEGHVVRVDGCIDVYRWSGANQWFEDRKGRWVAPDQFEDSDEWLGQIISPAEVAAREQAASSVACRMNAGELVKVMRLERRVQRQRRALSRLYARRHEWKARERAARREGMEEAAKEVDCGCDIREAVLARLESQGEKRASYLCTHGDVCSALQAAAIRAAAKENP